MKALLIFMGLILVGAIVVGLLLGNSELLNPSLHRAKVDKLKAETEAFRAQTAYEQRQREIELRLAEEKAAVELQALQDRRAKESEFLELAAIVGLIVGSIVVTTLGIGASYYIIAKARALPQGQAVKGIQLSDQRTQPLMSQRDQRNISERAKGPLSIQGSNVDPSRISYDGFLALCADFILPNSHQELPLDYTQPDDRRQYYSNGISHEVAQLYFSILQRARIVILGTNGCAGWVLRRQIQTLDDIKLRISREAFEDIVSWYSVPSRIEQLTVPEMQTEYSPRPIRGKDNGHSSEQTPTFPQARRRNGRRPAA